MAETANQPTNMPTRKVAFGSGAALIAFGIVLGVKQLAPDLDNTILEFVMYAAMAAAGPLVAWAVPEWKMPVPEDVPDLP